MKLSVVTVSYNSERTIEDTIKSIISQTYNNIEYIIVDGGSKDSTLEIIKNYETVFHTMKIEYKWISEKDNGIYDAMNKGIKLATGDIVGFLNSDDYFFDKDVLKDISIKFSDESISCVYGNVLFVDISDSNKIKRKCISREYKQGLFEKSWSPPHPSFYCKRSLYDVLGYYRIDFKIASDVELMYRFIEINKIKSLYFNRYVVVMRIGGVSTSGFKSTYIITKELLQAFKYNGQKLNIFKYIFYKLLKIKEIFI